MLIPPGPIRVLMATKPVDFRKGMDGLAALVKEQLRAAPFSGVIFCFRAKETVKPVKQNGKTDIVPQGFMPIAGDEFLFEQTVNCLLLPKSNGIPTWQSENVGERLMMKLPKQFETVFAVHDPLSEDIGRQLATWARGGNPSPQPAAGPAASPLPSASPEDGEAADDFDEDAPTATRRPLDQAAVHEE